MADATAKLVRDEIRDSLARPTPDLLAERNGQAVGLLVAQPPRTRAGSRA